MSKGTMLILTFVTALSFLISWICASNVSPDMLQWRETVTVLVFLAAMSAQLSMMCLMEAMRIGAKIDDLKGAKDIHG